MVNSESLEASTPLLLRVAILDALTKVSYILFPRPESSLWVEVVKRVSHYDVQFSLPILVGPKIVG